MKENVYLFAGMATRILKESGALKPGEDGLLKVCEWGSYRVDDQLAAREVVTQLLPGALYMGLDARAGPGVDVVMDLERPAREDLSADLVLCLETLEHVRRPWLAIETLARSCRLRRGHLILSVPFMFRIHEYPSDYWRYTPECLRCLLEDAGAADALVLQDAREGNTPHTVVAVASFGRPIQPAVRGRLEGAAWRTEADMAPFTFAAMFGSQAELNAFMTVAQPFLEEAPHVAGALPGGSPSPEQRVGSAVAEAAAAQPPQTSPPGGARPVTNGSPPAQLGQRDEDSSGLPVHRDRRHLRLDHQDLHPRPVAQHEQPVGTDHPALQQRGHAGGPGNGHRAGPQPGGGRPDVRSVRPAVALDPELAAPPSSVLTASSDTALRAPLDVEYERLCAEPSDIHEHLPTLRALASEAQVVVELGMRAGISTVALAAGRPRALVSIDVDEEAVEATRFHLLRRCGCEPALGLGDDTLQWPGGDGRRVELVQGSSLEVDPIPCDLLFVDTLHTEEQLEQELARWSCVVRRTIVLHDTETYGKIGEDGKNPGLMGAVRYWLALGEGQGRWRIKTHRKNNNGLMILERFAEER